MIKTTGLSISYLYFFLLFMDYHHVAAIVLWVQRFLVSEV